MTIDIPCQADIRGPAEQIFDMIIDFGGQERWLGKSSAFRGTTQISSDPVTLGTTYREPGPLGVRNGEVTELERPARVTFHQPMTMWLHAGIIDVTLRYTLTPAAGSGPGTTHVTRVVNARDPAVAEPVGAGHHPLVPYREQPDPAGPEGLRGPAVQHGPLTPTLGLGPRRRP